MKRTLNLILLAFFISGLAIAGTDPSNVLRLGNGSTTGNKRVILNRGASNPEIRWYESGSQVQVSKDGSTYLNIAADSNFGIAASVSSNTLVVSLKDAGGSDPSANSPVSLPFRSATAATGTAVATNFTAANSITLAATDSIGAPTTASILNVYLVSDTTSEICLSFGIFSDGSVQSASALTGGADTGGTTLWCTSAHTSRPVRRVGRVKATWSNPNWGSITEVSTIPFGDSQMVSNASSYLRMEAAKITVSGASAGAITTQSGAWLSGISVASNAATLTIASGMFSAAPWCVCSAENDSIGVCEVEGTITTTQVIVGIIRASTEGSRSGVMNVICYGLR